jgi:hypothetical protein
LALVEDDTEWQQQHDDGGEAGVHQLRQDLLQRDEVQQHEYERDAREDDRRRAPAAHELDGVDGEAKEHQRLLPRHRRRGPKPVATLAP